MPTKDKILRAAQQHRYYRKYKYKLKKRAIKWKFEQAKINYAFIKDLKQNTPCADCHLIYPACVMDFDHIKGKKLGNIGNVTRTWSLEKLKLEIAKCEIVCANCHRIRTHITR